MVTVVFGLAGENKRIAGGIPRPVQLIFEVASSVSWLCLQVVGPLNNV